MSFQLRFLNASVNKKRVRFREGSDDAISVGLVHLTMKKLETAQYLQFSPRFHSHLTLFISLCDLGGPSMNEAIKHVILSTQLSKRQTFRRACKHRHKPLWSNQVRHDGIIKSKQIKNLAESHCIAFYSWHGSFWLTLSGAKILRVIRWGAHCLHIRQRIDNTAKVYYLHCVCVKTHE